MTVPEWKVMPMAVLSPEIWGALTDGDDPDPCSEAFRVGLLTAIGCLAPDLLCARCELRPVDLPGVCAACSHFDRVG